MDVNAIKPVSGASQSSTQMTGKHPVIALELPSKPAPPPQQVPEVPRPSVDFSHTRQVIAEQVSRYLQASTRNLEFQVDSDSGKAVIVVRDADGQVIRRIPGEEVLQIVHRMNAQSGTVIDSIA